MKKLLALFFIILASLIGLPASTHTANGQNIGLICIAPTGSTSCPSTVSTFTGSIGSQFTVSVFLQDSDPIGGFEVFVKTINTILSPASIDLSGSLISQPNFTTLCVNGVAVQGSCSNAANGLGVAEVSTIDASGNNVCSAPCTGLLFSITYNIVGTGTPDISYPSNAGCASSVSGSDTCALIFDNGGNVDSENVQRGHFSNGVGDFSISAPPYTLSIFAGHSSTVTVTVTSTTGFSGLISLSVVVTPVVSEGATASLSPATISLASGETNTSTVTVNTTSTTPTGTYTLEIVATGTRNGSTITHNTYVTVEVIIFPANFDYSLSNNGPVTIVHGGSGTITITSTLTARTAQPVTLSCVTPLSTGITCGSFSVNPVTPTGSGAISNLAISVASSVVPGSYTLQVTGTPAGTTVSAATTTVSVTVVTLTGPDFTMTASPTSVTVSVGVAGTSTITVGPLNGFTGDVSLTSDNASCSLTPATVSGGSGTSTLSCAFSTTGSFVVTVTGTSGSLVHTATVDFTVTAATGFVLSWQGYDWDGVHEESLYFNGQFLTSLPPVDIPSNGAVWASFSFDITSYVVKGTNTLTFTHANWDCSVSDAVGNLQVTSGATVVYSNSTSLPLTCTQWLTYTLMNGTAPPAPAPPDLSISAGQSTAFPVVGETLTFSALSSGGVPPYMFTWNFGDGATGVGSTVNHEYAAPGTYTARATVADSASSRDTNFVDIIVTVSAPSSSPGTYTLSWQGYDWVGGQEETLAINGLLVATLPPVDIPSNGAVWASFSFDITSYVVKGTNTLTFTHANWDCATSDSVRNLQLTNGTTVVYGNATASPLACSQPLTYTFSV